MVSWVADYTARIAPAALKAAGVVGVCRYVSRYSWKVITKAEYQELRGASIDVILNFEDAATDWLGGASAGSSDATFAVGQAQSLGYPTGSTIAGSADFDMSAAQWTSGGRAYAVAFRDTLKAHGYTAGVYGPWDVLTWCSQLGGFDLFWQAGMSTAWSGGRNARPWSGAHLRQRRQLTVGGVQVDYNDILLDDWNGADMDFSTADRNAWAQARRTEALTHGLPATIGDAVHPSEPVESMVMLRKIHDTVTAGTSVTLSPEDRAALVAALPSAADVAAHVDVTALAAAIAAHIKVQ
jgi:glycoside hydrolase-like protein